MDAQSKATLDEILAKEVAALTDADKVFLRARRSYLSEEQKHVYAEVLNEIEEAPAETETASESEQVEEEKPKRARKAKES